MDFVGGWRSVAEIVMHPCHGGNLAWAAATFAIPETAWLDLSTGISPWPWDVKTLPCAVLQRLPPEDLTPLQTRAAAYYGCEAETIMPTPGSQFAIQQIPRLLSPRTVAVPHLGYQEHHQAWQNNGHRLRLYHDLSELRQLISNHEVAVVIVINPNNPSGERYCQQQLAVIHTLLLTHTQNSGLLVVDEAFMDATPEHSIAPLHWQNTLVLRSFGKFFGLAGVRLGFVIGAPAWLALLRPTLSLWLISHPAIWYALQALQDTQWVNGQRARIAAANDAMSAALQRALPHIPFSQPCNQGGLFITLQADKALLWPVFMALARQGVLTRYGEFSPSLSWLRFGLTDRIEQLERALAALPRPL